MNDSRFGKLAPLSGALAVVLMLVAQPLGARDYLPSADRAVEIFSDIRMKLIAGTSIGLISAFFLVWFAGSLYRALYKREGGSGWLAMVAFGGGVTTAIAFAARYTVIATAGARANSPGGISPMGAVTLYDLSGSLVSQMAAFALAVFIGATAVVSLRTMMFPTWFGWLSILITIGLLSPMGPIVFFIALVWLLVVSIWLYRRGA